MMRQPPWWQSANWIWVTGFNDTNPEGQTCLFRRQFVLAAQQTEPCPLRVSADTRYRLYVNNVSVSVGPCKSHPGRWYYETVDIQPYLVQGVNVIGAVVLRFSDRHVGSLSLMRTVLPGLIVHCEVQVRLNLCCPLLFFLLPQQTSCSLPSGADHNRRYLGSEVAY